MSKRIPEHFIEDLLAKTDIADIVGSRVSLTSKGNERTGLCPFHAEKTPSFSVSSKKQFFYCFGCSESGNSIGFIMKYEGVDFRDAVEILANQAGMVVPANEMTKGEKTTMAMVSVIEASGKAYLSSSTEEMSKAIEFLKDCGISQSTMGRYCVGFSSESAIKTIHSLPEASIVELGLATKGKTTLKHWTSKKLILPVRDRKGGMRGFISQPMSAAKPVPSRDTALFNERTNLYGLHEAHDVIRQTDTIIVVESPLEVLALHSHGVQCGVSTVKPPITQEALESLFGIVSNVVFCFSSNSVRKDEFQDTLKTSLKLLKAGRDIAFTILPTKNRNCAVYLKNHNADDFHTLVDNAVPVVDILYKKLASTKEVSGDAKEEWVLQQGLIALTNIPDSLYRRLAIRRFTALSDTATAKHKKA